MNNESLISKYDYLSEFKQNIAIFSKDGLYGIVLKGGVETCPAKFNYIIQFNDGIAEAFLGENNEKVYIDLAGNLMLKNGYNNFITLPAEYDFGYDFENGYAIVRKDNRFGIIDEKGTTIVPPEYTTIHNYIHGYSKGYKKGGYDILDEKGHILFVGLEDVTILENDLFYVKRNNDYVKINTNNQIVLEYNNKHVILPEDITYAKPYHNNISVAKKSKWGCVNQYGREIIPFEFDSIEDFVDDFAISKKENNVYLLTIDGKKNDFSFDGADIISMGKGLFCLKKGIEQGIVNVKGDFVLPYSQVYIDNYQDYCLIQDFRNLVGIFIKDNYKYIAPAYRRILGINGQLVEVDYSNDFNNVFIDFEGNSVICVNGTNYIIKNAKCAYLDINCNVIALNQENKAGIVRYDDNTILEPFVNDSITYFGQFYLCFEKNNENYLTKLLDKNFKVIFSINKKLSLVKELDDIFILHSDSGLGIVDKKGIIRLEFKYSDIYEEKDYYIARRNKYLQLLDKQYNPISELIFDDIRIEEESIHVKLNGFEGIYRSKNLIDLYCDNPGLRLSYSLEEKKDLQDTQIQYSTLKKSFGSYVLEDKEGGCIYKIASDDYKILYHSCPPIVAKKCNSYSDETTIFINEKGISFIGTPLFYEEDECYIISNNNKNFSIFDFRDVSTIVLSKSDLSIKNIFHSRENIMYFFNPNNEEIDKYEILSLDENMIKTLFSSVYKFFEWEGIIKDRIIVKKEKEYGFLKKNGDYVSLKNYFSEKNQYNAKSDISFSLLLYCLDSIINDYKTLQINQIIEHKYLKAIIKLNDNLYVIKTSDGLNLMNESGDILLDNYWDSISKGVDNQFIVSKKLKSGWNTKEFFGVIDNNNLIIDTKWNSISEINGYYHAGTTTVEIQKNEKLVYHHHDEVIEYYDVKVEVPAHCVFDKKGGVVLDITKDTLYKEIKNYDFRSYPSESAKDVIWAICPVNQYEILDSKILYNNNEYQEVVYKNLLKGRIDDSQNIIVTCNSRKKQHDLIVPKKYDWAFDSNNEYVIVVRDGKFGLIDNHGNEILDTSFSYISIYSTKKGTFYVGTGNSSIILLDGNIVYKSDNNYSINHLRDDVFYQDNTIIKTTGEKWIRKYNTIHYSNFHFGYKQEDLQLYKYDITRDSYSLKDEKKTYCFLSEANNICFYKNEHIIELPSNFDWGEPISDEYMLIGENGQIGLCSFDYTILIPIQYTRIEYLGYNLYACKGNEYWTIFDVTCQSVIQTGFTSIEKFNTGRIYAKIKKNNSWGIVNFIGEMTIEPIYSNIEIQDDNYFRINIEPFEIFKGIKFTTYSNMYLDIFGNTSIKVSSNRYKSIDITKLPKKCFIELTGTEYLIVVGVSQTDYELYKHEKINYQNITHIREGKYGIINSEGEFLIPMKYNYMRYVGDYIFECLAEDSQLYQLIDVKGNVYFESKCYIETKISDDILLIGKNCRGEWDYFSRAKEESDYLFDFSSIIKVTDTIFLCYYSRYLDGVYTKIRDEKGKVLFETSGEIQIEIKEDYNLIKYNPRKEYVYDNQNDVRTEKEYCSGYAVTDKKWNRLKGYDYIGDFQYGHAIVTCTKSYEYDEPIYDDDDNIIDWKTCVDHSETRYGLINKSFEIVLPCKYKKLNHEANGVLRSERGNYYIDYKGNNLIKRNNVYYHFPQNFQYKGYCWIDSDLLVVTRNKKKGIYKLSEKREIIPCVYDKIHDNSRYLSLIKNNKFFVYNKNGELIMEPFEKNRTYQFKDYEFIRICKNEYLYNIIDAEYKRLLPNDVKKILFFVDDILAFRDITGIGWIDFNTMKIKSVTATSLSKFKYGMAKYNIGGYIEDAIVKSGKWGIVDKEGNVLLEAKYKKIFDFYNDIAVVEADMQKKMFAINMRTKQKSMLYDYIEIVGANQIKVKNGEKNGLLDKNMQVIFDCIYDEISNVHSNIYLLEYKSNDCRLFNLTIGVESSSYETIITDKSLFIVKRDDKWGVINTFFVEILQMKYQSISINNNEIKCFTSRYCYEVFDINGHYVRNGRNKSEEELYWESLERQDDEY